MLKERTKKRLNYSPLFTILCLTAGAIGCASPDAIGGSENAVGSCSATVDPSDRYYDRFEGTHLDNSCVSDSDCVVGGCSGEVCAAESGYTTCEGLSSVPSGSCGCVAGQCIWAAGSCGGDEDGGGACVAEVDPSDRYYDRFEGTHLDNSCDSDSDCIVGGCSGEVCAAEGAFTTCEGLSSQPSGSCGCVEGQCIWAVGSCGEEENGGGACVAEVDPSDRYYDRFEGTHLDNSCDSDSDCIVGGCSGEVCAAEGAFTTCEGLSSQPSGSCGCVEGQCIWAVGSCGEEENACVAEVDPSDRYYDRFEGTHLDNSCDSDSDCIVGGCSGEVCAAEGAFTTCEGLSSQPSGSCGCVEGQCIWAVGSCGGDEDGGDGDGGEYDPCAGKSLGDLCSLCDPADADCVETAVTKVCDASGVCSEIIAH